MKKISVLDQLIYLFAKLPGLGPRSARRIVLHLLKDKERRVGGLIHGLEQAVHKLTQCLVCGNIDCRDRCSICTDTDRDNAIIAIVDTVAELWAIERSATFHGRYHVLGTCSTNAASSRDPLQLRLPQLLARCQEHKITELIIATNSTLDGQTTAYLITEFFKGQDLMITRLASGIPIGGELDYLDEGTLSIALESRKNFN